MRSLALLTALTIATILPAQQTPSSIEAPAEAKLLLAAKGVGDQVYACIENKWVLKAPDAKLMDAQHHVVGSHFAGPTWQLTDGSKIRAKAVANQPSPDASSVAWLLLRAIPGTGNGRFAAVTYIRRTETRGGVAPTAPCAGGELRVPYTATYSFYGR